MATTTPFQAPISDAVPLAAIRVSGADADTFLQGQLTQDLRKLDSSSPLLAGYCSPKGRLLAVMQLARDADGVLLHVHGSVADAVLKRLRMHVLRSKVTLELTPAPALTPEQDQAWRLQQIRAGVPVIYRETQDEFVPQMVNLDHLGAISFDKGCYTGQEIVARLHYLGQLKRRMFRSHAAATSVTPGTPVHVAGEAQAVGMVVDAARDGDGCALSVVLQLAHAASAALHLADTARTPLAAPSAYF
ncbi:MAG TPA: hypothetical protein VHE37_02895 [Nevskiaceae bacterium]|nr:hypothetical protein [Nevskiaceae bacterium]